MFYKEILPGHDKIHVVLLGDPAYPILPYCTRQYPNPHANEKVIFNNMLKSARNPIEYAFWETKNKITNFEQEDGYGSYECSISNLVLSSHICETLNRNSVDDDAVGRQLEYDRL